MGCGSSEHVQHTPLKETPRDYKSDDVFKQFKADVSMIPTTKDHDITLKQATKTMNQYYSNSELSDEMLRIYDGLEPDTEINPDEYIVNLRRTRDRLIKMNVAFDAIDVDKSGTLDADEMKEHLAKLYNVDATMIESLITIYDDDDNRTMNKQEFFGVMTLLEEKMMY